MNFPNDWIAPGEYRYCGCGEFLLPADKNICAYCKYRPTLNDCLCFCGNQATTMFIHGFRCDKHAFQINPSNATIGEKIIITTGYFRQNIKCHSQEFTECHKTHEKLETKRLTLAKKRQAAGIARLFWMQ